VQEEKKSNGPFGLIGEIPSIFGDFMVCPEGGDKKTKRGETL